MGHGVGHKGTLAQKQKRAAGSGGKSEKRGPEPHQRGIVPRAKKQRVEEGRHQGLSASWSIWVAASRPP